MRLVRFFLAMIALVPIGATLRAAESPSADEKAIRDNAQLYVKAFNARDAKALASLWAPKAVYVNRDTGKRFEGREAIQTALTTMFKKQGPAKLSVDIQSIRFVTPSVAVEDGLATVVGDDDEPEQSNYTAVNVKHDGKWLIDSIRETVVPPPAGAAEHLKALEWLVGEWNDSDDDATIHSTYHWSVNHAFLIHAFSVQIADKIEMRGMQVIAWDPAEKRIRSWAFDSDGGFAEGMWEQDGDRFVIRTNSTLPDGKRGTAINTIRKIDDNHLAWSSTARHVDGEMLPNIEEVNVVREDADASDSDSGPAATEPDNTASQQDQ
ncbi:MAG: SgcJ/EcaC family oxidoreductase [Planctomycetes bacterium]|nr:SgcJ/EcaC family oxidoreductase [Planctomycetota bacterium]